MAVVDALTVDGADGARIAFGRFDGRIASTIAGVAVLSVMAGGARLCLQQCRWRRRFCDRGVCDYGGVDEGS